MPGVPDQGERELQEFLVGAVGDLEPLDLGLGQADLGVTRFCSRLNMSRGSASAK